MSAHSPSRKRRSKAVATMVARILRRFPTITVISEWGKP